ncbi:response regulator [Flavobacterium sp.]|uniref:response regulator n=1 Tax=Flavobacterium sp. TaxID=239 RepID=UPI0039E2CDC3
MSTPKRCFFIDDDEDDRDFFCTALQNINPEIECLFAKDGTEAIDQLVASPEMVPDYIFIDMNMPLMDGKQCLAAIREIDRLDQVPVYLYSTSGAPKLIDEVLQMGAKEFLIKPTSMNALEQLLRRIVI